MLYPLAYLGTYFLEKIKNFKYFNLINVLDKIFETLEGMKSEMKTLRKAMEKRDEKKYASISSGCFPLKSFEEIEEFERKALDSAYADDVVSCVVCILRHLAIIFHESCSIIFCDCIVVTMIIVKYTYITAKNSLNLGKR